MRKKRRAARGFQTLLLTLALLFPAVASCPSTADFCRSYCRQAAECFQCGSSANMERCQSTCEDLSVDDKKALGECTDDCESMRICPLIVQNLDLNPCVP